MRLYKKKEHEFVKTQRELYDVDPRVLWGEDSIMVPADKVLTGEELSEEDVTVYKMSDDEKARLAQIIEDYDNRPPFDEETEKKNFVKIQEYERKRYEANLPEGIKEKIADMRVFALGYCSGEVLKALKMLDRDTRKKLKQTEEKEMRARLAENLPAELTDKIIFHDCEVTKVSFEGRDIIIKFDITGGFTIYDTLIFRNAEIVEQEESILNARWIYDELYRTDDGYEIHIMFEGEKFSELFADIGDIKEGLCYLTIRCSDIAVEKTDENY